MNELILGVFVGDWVAIITTITTIIIKKSRKLAAKFPRILETTERKESVGAKWVPKDASKENLFCFYPINFQILGKDCLQMSLLILRAFERIN